MNSNQNNKKLGALFFDKIKNSFSKLSQKGVYMALLLYYAYNGKDTPKWAKNIVIGCISYLVAPIDGIPDLAPFLGFTDDIGVLGYGIVAISCYITNDVKENAKKGLNRFFKTIDPDAIAAVDRIY